MIAEMRVLGVVDEYRLASFSSGEIYCRSNGSCVLRSRLSAGVICVQFALAPRPLHVLRLSFKLIQYTGGAHLGRVSQLVAGQSRSCRASPSALDASMRGSPPMLLAGTAHHLISATR